MRRIRAILFCGLGLLLAACSEELAKEQAPAKIQDSSAVPPLQDYGSIGGDFSLVDQHGELFELQVLRGRSAMLFFGYTYCPDICPVTLSKMSRVYELLDKGEQDLATLFITVDPERDTEEKLAEYLDYFAIKAIGLRGEREQIDQVIGQYGGHYSLDKEEGRADYFVDHSTYTYLIDQQGMVRFLFRQSDDPELMAAVAGQLFAGTE